MNENKKQTAVVFIHGFTGGSKTWENDSGEKFKDMLMGEASINEAFDFFEFEYYTSLTDIFDSAPVQELLSILRIPKIFGKKKKIRTNKPIKNLSEHLSSFLRLKLSGYSEVILVAHSMGGLIAKDFILNYEKGDKPKPVGFVSIAVPHKGSLSAQILAPIKNINARELVPLNEYTDSLNNRWIDSRKALPESIYLIAQHDQCVPSVSATPFTLKTAQKFVLEHDHISICKPSSKDDMAYIALKNYLAKRAYTMHMQSTTKISYTNSAPDYNKEIFVIKMILCDIGTKGIDDAKESFFNAEVITKAADKDDQEMLLELQSKVLSLYRQSYNKYTNLGLSSNEVFSQVHEKLLEEDSKSLEISVNYINFLHKKGLLHQLANKLCTSVIWSDDTTIKDIMSYSK
ncbi:ABC-three component system protein [Pseudomonas chlororaphis]|uniref:ABC-three component system protein n=1 Tax=Pseudomonas chlororaphis TaxID=587753 RepID=UPI0037CB040D